MMPSQALPKTGAIGFLPALLRPAVPTLLTLPALFGAACASTAAGPVPAPPPTFAASAPIASAAPAMMGSPAAAAVPIVVSGLSLPHHTAHGTISGQECSAAEAEPYLRLLRNELSRYPRELLARAGVRRICVARGLTFGGQPWTGIPVFDEHTLWLDAVRGRTVANYQARLIHHELFHLVDKALGSGFHNDPDWASLNPRGFRYGPGGENYQNTGRDVFAMLDRTGGFITGYSESALEEDKAEVFSCMTVMPRETARRAAADAVLRAKVELLRSKLESFCPGSSTALFDK